MLLTISTTHRPATDLGFLLHKNPAHLQSFAMSFGKAHVFYPEAGEDKCTAALLLDVDPVGLVRGRGMGEGALDQYVNDRPYVASSFLSVALADVFRSALAGKSKERPELVETPMPLKASIAAISCRGGEPALHRLFEPLGYAVTARRRPLDPHFPEWGDSHYFAVTLEATTSVRDLLRHLYVLIPVLDEEKHYWVDEAEVEKLLRHGQEWLAGHPERDHIVHRYLRRQRRLTNAALARLLEEDQPSSEASGPIVEGEAVEGEEVAGEAVEPIAAPAVTDSPLSPKERVTLHQQRLEAAVEVLRDSRARRVLDLGCGEGRLLQLLLKEKFERIVGMDVSHRALEIAKDRLHWERMPEKQRERLELFQGSLIYRDARLAGYDAAAIIEVIEHLDAGRLAAFERVLFEFARPGLIVLTTPNREYNALWPSLPAGQLRHKDHRFEWTRAEFETWGRGVAERFGYGVRFAPVGPSDSERGAPSQMGVFSLPGVGGPSVPTAGEAGTVSAVIPEVPGDEVVGHRQHIADDTN